MGEECICTRKGTVGKWERSVLVRGGDSREMGVECIGKRRGDSREMGGECIGKRRGQ